MKLSMILEAVDRASAPFRRMLGGARALTGGIKQLGREGTAGARAIDRIDVSARRGAGGLGRLFTNVRRLAGAAGMRGLELAARGTGFAIGRTLRLAGQLASKLAVGTILGATAGAGYFFGGIVGLASQFEQFQVVLENTEGSAAGARRAMAWVRDFAKTTPYDVAQVMDAFVKLKAYGIDPTDGSLRSLGNAASGMSKDINAAVEMLADAQTGEFERLKEFGIRAKVQGDNVAFTYMKNGKEISRSAKNSAADIKTALVDVFDQRFGGMMDRQSRTLSGMWSNIKDQVAGFQLDVANAGFFDFLKGKVQDLLNWIGKLAADGTLQRWAENVSKWMVDVGMKMEAAAKSTDWRQVASDIATVAGAIWKVVSAVARLIEFLGRVDNSAIGRLTMIGANPVMAGMNEAARMKAGRANPVNLSPRTGAPVKWFGPVPKANLAPGPAVKWPGKIGAAGTKSETKVAIALSTPPGVSARVTSVSGNRGGVSVATNRGRVGAGA